MAGLRPREEVLSKLRPARAGRPALWDEEEQKWGCGAQLWECDCGSPRVAVGVPSGALSGHHLETSECPLVGGADMVVTAHKEKASGRTARAAGRWG